MDNDNTITPVGFGDIIVGNDVEIPVVNDGDNQLRWESRVHSGDYFTTLATELENVADQTDDEAVKIQLRTMVTELEYIQMRYQLTQKKPGARRFGG